MQKHGAFGLFASAALSALAALTAPAQGVSPSAATNTSNPLSEYTCRSWQTDEGLPHNLVRSITQTPDGYLWVGTRVGLARFDGIHFSCFNAKNTPALASQNISAL